MSFLDWIFGRGKDEDRSGPAHSSDRHGFWKDLWKLRKALAIDPEHSGSVDIYDHFGCAPHNDNSIKRERREDWRPVLKVIVATAQFPAHSSPDTELQAHARLLLGAFEEADSELLRQAKAALDQMATTD